jgi:hypothetical protein
LGGGRVVGHDGAGFDPLGDEGDVGVVDLGALGGMGLGSSGGPSWLMSLTRSELAGSPGTMTTPSRPPLRAEALVARERPPLWFMSKWHLPQLVTRTGRTFAV